MYLIALLLLYGSFSCTYMRDCKDYKDVSESLYQLQYACGNICDTSIKSEKDIHSGRKFSNSTQDFFNDFSNYASRIMTFTICIHIFTVLKGKYFSEISKQYYCDDMFAEDLVDSPVTYNGLKTSWYVTYYNMMTHQSVYCGALVIKS